MANLIDRATADGTLGEFVRALQLVGLAEQLREPGPFTLFAPDDEAFAAFRSSSPYELYQSPAPLTLLLLYHISPHALTAADLMGQSSVPTLHGANLAITATAGLRADSAYLTRADIEADNGIIHVLNRVMVPPQ